LADQLSKTYEPSKYEPQVYRLWEDAKAFSPVDRGQGQTFCIIMPPPNANGELHVGHAVGYTLTDAVVRFKRMQGYKTLWLPGSDHAGIETQFVYERDVLAPQGLNRMDLGPAKFYQDVMKFTLEKQQNILTQFQAMGFSADWSKLKFTLDPDVIEIVYDTFKKLHADGHIYRGNRIVNWCPRCQAAFADIEIDRREREDDFYILKYGPFQIGTARPETKFGDKYVVVHPSDKRYQSYKEGETFEAEWINGRVKATVVKDRAIDPKFGTGAMTVTPWHDATDFRIAEDKGIEKQQIIDYQGKLMPIAEEFAGMDIAAARPKIVAKLKAKGLLVKVEKQAHSIGVHDRCGTIIEPQISKQWFLRIKELNKAVINALKNDEIKFFPPNYKKIALNWLAEEHDWCISRQIWWGIRIPIYYNRGTDKTKRPYIVATHEDEAARYYGKGNYRAETDTFDTWFSSGQWPFATLKTTGDFKEYYPTDLMGTAREILHKWVTRMIMFGLYATKTVPFKNVYLWGLVTDEHGAKMSKSKGNVLDPLAMTQKYGTDAVRMAGAISNTPGNDSPLGENKFAAYRNFCNKLWNVSRFCLDVIGDTKISDLKNAKPQTLADEWILFRLSEAIKLITSKYESYRLNEAAFAVYHLLWDDFADWYIEASKVQPNPEVLAVGLTTILKLAHPLVPFITEAIWQAASFSKGELITSNWPSAGAADTQAAARFDELKQVISEARTLKSELELGRVGLYFSDSQLLKENAELVAKLAGLTEVKAVEQGRGLPLVDSNQNAWLGVEQATIEDYANRLEAKLERAKTYSQSLDKKLANPGYKQNAPAELVNSTETKLEASRAQEQRIKKQLDSLK